MKLWNALPVMDLDKSTEILKYDIYSFFGTIFLISLTLNDLAPGTTSAHAATVTPFPSLSLQESGC